MPQTGSTAVAGRLAVRGACPSRARSATISARIDSAISVGVRAPMSSPAGVCSCARSSSGTSSDVADRRRRASGSPPARRRARRPAAPPRARPPRRARARRPRPRRRRAPARRARPADHREAERPAQLASAPRATGVSPTTNTRGAGRWGSRKISSAPPLRQGLRDRHRAVHGGRLLARPRRERCAAAAARRSPARAARAAAPRTRAQAPPTKPSIVPSAQHERGVAGADAGRAAARARPWPRRTARAPRSAPRRGGRARPRSLWRRRPSLHRLPHPRRACRACRCAARRAAASASMTALTIVGGEPTVADSPDRPWRRSGGAATGVTV